MLSFIKEPANKNLDVVNGYLVDLSKQIFFHCDGVLRSGYNVFNEYQEKIGSMEETTHCVYFGV